MTRAETVATHLASQELTPLIRNCLLTFAKAAAPIIALLADMPKDVREAIAFQVEIAVAWKRLVDATPHGKDE